VFKVWRFALGLGPLERVLAAQR